MNLFREFKPALTFLAKFLALYFAGNILYGLFIEASYPQADIITSKVTSHTSALLNVMGYETTFEPLSNNAKIALIEGTDVVLYVFEGCNGINVVIVFLAFLVAFGGRMRSFLAFIPVGLILIHLFNLLRIGFLFYLARGSTSMKSKLQLAITFVQAHSYR